MPAEIEDPEAATKILHQTLAGFGWTADETFWKFYYNLEWFYNVVNALVVLAVENERISQLAYDKGKGDGSE